jgi:hypothetical protein
MKLKNIMKYSDYLKEKLENNKFDVIEFLSSIGDSEVNGDLNDLITTHDVDLKIELIEDILIHVGDMLEDDEYHMVEDELKKQFIKNK